MDITKSSFWNSDELLRKYFTLDLKAGVRAVYLSDDLLVHWWSLIFHIIRDGKQLFFSGTPDLSLLGRGACESWNQRQGILGRAVESGGGCWRGIRKEALFPGMAKHLEETGVVRAFGLGWSWRPPFIWGVELLQPRVPPEVPTQDIRMTSFWFCYQDHKVSSREHSSTWDVQEALWIERHM